MNAFPTAAALSDSTAAHLAITAQIDAWIEARGFEFVAFAIMASMGFAELEAQFEKFCDEGIEWEVRDGKRPEPVPVITGTDKIRIKDEAMLSRLVLLGRVENLSEVEALGATREWFAYPEYGEIFDYIRTFRDEHGKIPSPQTVTREFPTFKLVPVEEPWSYVLSEWKEGYVLWTGRRWLMDEVSEVLKDHKTAAARLPDVLRRELERVEAIGVNHNGHGSSEAIPFSTIEPERVAWLWQDFIVANGLNVVAADPKVGKGLWSCWFAGQITSGKFGPPRNCAFLGHEDALGIQAARLVAAGVDMDRVFALRGRNGTILTLPSHANEIRRQIEANEIGCLFVDPVNSHTDAKLKSGDDKDMRTALSPLALIADECGCAIVVIHHFSKGTLGQQMIYRLGGSQAYSGVARSVLALGRLDEHPEEDEESSERPSPFLKDAPDENSRYLFQTGNYAADGKPIRFDIETRTVEVKGGTDEVPRFLYMGPAEGVSEADVFNGGAKQKRGRPKDAGLRKWIEDLIGDRAEVPAQEIYDAAHGDGHSDRTVRDVLRREMGWTSVRVGKGNIWRKPKGNVEPEGSDDE